MNGATHGITIKEAVEKAGGVRSVAFAMRVSTQSIYNYLSGKREPSDEFLNHLGLERVVTYRPKRKKKAA